MAIAERAAPAAAVSELKAYLRLEDSREDPLLAGLLRAATETVEAMLGQVLFEREIEERGVVSGGLLQLRAEPALSLVGAAIKESDGSMRDLTPEEVAFDIRPYGIGTVQGADIGDGSELIVRFRAGMATDWNRIPEILRLSVVRAAAHFFAHRDSPDDGGLPPVVHRMVAPWRARRLL